MTHGYRPRSAALRTASALALCASMLPATGTIAAEEAKELNIYSARHYQTDEALYKGFTDATGIKLNRIELGDEPLLERLRSEGSRSPADVVLLVDASRIVKAQQEGLFQPVKSAVLDQKIPKAYRADDGSWYGFSTRSRVIVYNRDKVKPAEVDTYEKLADPVNKGRVCTRSGSHPYNLSLFGSMVARDGEAKTKQLMKGIVDNMARAPKGGDTDQIKAVASGECQVALTNSYYFVRLMRSEKPEDKEVVSKVAMVWPNQNGAGAHMNLAGGAVAKHAPHREAAVKFLEYLASAQAQTYFAAGNNEWPVVEGAKADNPALDSLGKFKADLQPVEQAGRNVATAQKLLNEVGYK